MALIEQYHTFDLDITPLNGAYRVQVVQSPSGEATGEFDIPNFADELLAWQQHAASDAELKQLGSQLFDALFSGEVGQCLHSSLAYVDSERLRINLRFNQVPELAYLPWELMHDSTSDHYLALSIVTPIVRYLALNIPAPERIVVEPPLKILALFPNPKDTPPLDSQSEWNGLNSALSKLQQQRLICLERLTSPTIEALQERLLGDPIHVLHFMGHGHYAASQETATLIFEDEHGKSNEVKATALGQMLHNHESLRLVYLNACDTALGSEHDIFTGLASTLVRQGIPAAVAMQRPVYDDSAQRLAKTFYQAIAANYPLEAALVEARLSIAQKPSMEWATPVLFSRSTDSLLIFIRPPCPYPGMVPFTEEQSHLFFGRESEVDEMVARLRHQSFLAVIGPSGSGKSSLVYAGLIPALRNQQAIIEMRPGDTPHTLLRQKLGQTALPPGSISMRRPTLLFIDQFEETFIQSEEAEAARFLTALAAMTGRTNLTIVLTMRADFYADIMDSPLWRHVKANRLEVTALDRRALSAAIVKPAQHVGVTLAGALVERLRADAAGETGALPLIQETLLQLWQRVSQPHLDLKTYEEFGREGRSGLQVAIARLADLTYDHLNEVEQGIALRLFLNLVQPGAQRADTRRRRSEAELLGQDDDPELFEQVLQKLADQRLITLSSNEEGQRLIDLSHEVLIRSWPKLRDWLAEYRAGLPQRDALEARLQAWLESEHDTSALLSGRLLAAALEWSNQYPILLTEQLKNFLDESSAYRLVVTERRRNRTRFTTVVLTMLVLLLFPALFLGGNIGMFYRRQASAWQHTSFPSDEVTSIALAVPNDETVTPRICIGTSNIGVGCSFDGREWNIYQRGLPTIDSTWFNTRDRWWSALTWSLWPASVRAVTSIDIDVLNPRRIAIYMRNAGLYVSEDSGVQWRALVKPTSTSTLPLFGGSKLRVYGEHLVVLVGTDQEVAPELWRSLFISLDDGRTWQQFGGSQQPLGVVFDFILRADASVSTPVLYAATENGLFEHQLTGNAEWLSLFGPEDGSTLIKLAVDDTSDTFYAAAYHFDSRKSTLYRWQEDEPMPPPLWSRLQDGSVRSLAVNPDPSSYPLWVLFERRGDIFAIRHDGTADPRGHRPGWRLWSYAHVLTLHETATREVVPLLGHTDGLLQYEAD